MSGLAKLHARGEDGKPLCGARPRKWGSLFAQLPHETDCERCRAKLPRQSGEEQPHARKGRCVMDINIARNEIAKAFQKAGDPTTSFRLRTLPAIDAAGARETWLLTLREAAVVAIDSSLRAMKDGNRVKAWRRVVKALDTHGAEIAMVLGALDAVEPAKRRAA